MNLKQLLLKYKIKDIIARLIVLYPTQKKNKKGHIKALEELYKLNPTKSNVKIHVYKYYDNSDKRYYNYVSGIDNAGKLWALAYTEWNEWLAMKIDRRSLKEFNNIDIVCHCLWEMTFNGYSNKAIKKAGKRLANMRDNIKLEGEEYGLSKRAIKYRI